MPPKNNYYNEVILNDPTLTADNPVSGHEIQVIVGSRGAGIVEQSAYAGRSVSQNLARRFGGFRSS